jgi:hypothetical protein
LNIHKLGRRIEIWFSTKTLADVEFDDIEDDSRKKEYRDDREDVVETECKFLGFNEVEIQEVSKGDVLVVEVETQY